MRLDAARMILKTMTTREVPDFLRHLPATDRTKMALSEPITYGAIIMAMDPQGGPKPRDVLSQFLGSTEMGAKLTAAGSYYTVKKSEAGALAGLEEDRTPVPRCEPADQCGWQCDIPKAPGSQEKDTKTISTIGDFVRWCVEPSLQGG